MTNSDTRMRSLYANIEKEANGEVFRKVLSDSLDTLEQSHSYNVSRQHDVDDTWEEDYDPLYPQPAIRKLIPVTKQPWGTFTQIDQDGNITMPA